MAEEMLPFSKFMHKTLLPEEKIVRSAHFPGIYVLWCYFVLICCAVAGGFIQYLILRYLGVDTFLPLIGGCILGFTYFMLLMMKMWTTEIVLTDKRLIHKRGFVQIHVEEVDIEQLASQKVDQSLLGRLLNYGEIYIRCIEATDVWLPAIDGPYDFVNALEREKQEYRDRYSKTVRVRQHGMSPGDS